MEKAYIEVNGSEVEVEFMGVFQSSVVLDPSPLVGGHSGGVMAQPVVVVKHEGELKQFNLNKVRFKKVEDFNPTMNMRYPNTGGLGINDESFLKEMRKAIMKSSY